MSKNDRLFKKIETFERLSLYGKRSSFLERLAQDASATLPVDAFSDKEREQVDNVGGIGNPIRTGIPPVPQNVQAPKTPVVPTAPKMEPQATTIPSNIQKALNSVLIHDDIGTPVKTDGALGPETQQALNNYKKHFNLSNMNNQALFNDILTRNQTNNQYDEAKTTVENRPPTNKNVI